MFTAVPWNRSQRSVQRLNSIPKLGKLLKIFQNFKILEWKFTKKNVIFCQIAATVKTETKISNTVELLFILKFEGATKIKNCALQQLFELL